MQRRADSDDPSEVFLTDLLLHGHAPQDACPPALLAHAEALGLIRADGLLSVPADWAPLTADAIRGQLRPRARQWLTRLDVYAAVGSTHQILVDRAQQGLVAGNVCLAEVQLAGRGRRGRSWVTPLGGSLAVSLGFAARRPPTALGGLSLALGLAVVDALESCGVAGLALKWPNDILLAGAKLGGILIEYVGSGSGAAVVVGLGINVQLPAAARVDVDQAMADLVGAVDPLPSRASLAARLISGIVEFEAEFMVRGFAPFAAAFDARHLYQGMRVRVMQDQQTLDARVLGVAADGGLRLETQTGEVVVYGGEVSLRPHSEEFEDRV